MWISFIRLAVLSCPCGADSIMQDPDLRLEYRYRIQEPLAHLRNPWHAARYIAPLQPEAATQPTISGGSGVETVVVAHGRGVVRAKENGSVLYDGEVHTLSVSLSFVRSFSGRFFLSSVSFRLFPSQLEGFALSWPRHISVMLIVISLCMSVSLKCV